MEEPHDSRAVARRLDITMNDTQQHAAIVANAGMGAIKPLGVIARASGQSSIPGSRW
jgi:hypothetical protein